MILYHIASLETVYAVQFIYEGSKDVFLNWVTNVNHLHHLII